MLNGERKRYNLKRKKKPRSSSYVSGVINYIGLTSVTKANICVYGVFEKAIAKQMPYGLDDDHQAYISVIQLSKNDWIVTASYLDDSKSVILWMTDKRPSWSIPMKKVKKENVKLQTKDNT